MNQPAFILAVAVTTFADCGSCGSSYDRPTDNVFLGDTPVMVHIADVLDDANLTVGELVGNDGVSLQAPADPSALFEQRFAAHQALPALGADVELSVLTYNVGLLDRTYLIFEHVAVPDKNARRDAQAAVLFSGDFDIMVLQEVWDTPDANLLRDAAQAAGYDVYYGSNSLHDQHGLFTAIKSELITGVEQFDEVQFDEQRPFEYFPGPGVDRGYIRWSFDLAGTSQRVHVYNTHATSYAEYWEIREDQARQLGRDIASQPASDIVIFGGDLNSGPYYLDDDWAMANGDNVPEWWRNAVAYPMWLHYGEMYDVVNAARIPEDVSQGDIIPTDHSTFTSAPYGSEAWCDATRNVIFTGSDCNSLYFEQYAGTEPPARLDHLMVRDPSANVRVDDAWVDFTAPIAGSGYDRELSDHYALGALLRVSVD